MFLTTTVSALVMAAVQVFGPFCGCTVTQVKDGDTLELRAEIFPGLTQTFVGDLASQDAPNDGPVSATPLPGYARCDAERTKAAQAKDYAKKLIAQESDQQVSITQLYRGLGNGRFPVEIELNNQPDGVAINFGQAMANAGFAKPWPQPQAEANRPDWCS